MRFSRLSILSMVFLPFFVTEASSDTREPRIAFAVKDGFVEFALRQNGEPIADAIIEITDDKGRKFSGESGPDGEGAFPSQNSASFTVEIKTGARTADPIRLYKTADGIEPARVLLSYGLRPCCRGLAKAKPIIVGSPFEPQTPAASEESASWLWLCAFPIGLLMTAALTITIRQNQTAASFAENP